METREFTFGVTADGRLVQNGTNIPMDDLRKDGWRPLSFQFHGGGYRVVMERGTPVDFDFSKSER